MTTPLYALIGFVFWTIGIVLTIGAIRVSQVLSGKVAPNGFPSGQPHGSDAYWRLNRAHANCVENLPLFAAVVLAGHVSGLTSGSFATAAQIHVLARVGQTLAHVSSGSALAVNVRFTFFAIQIACLIYMALAVVQR
ncbi:MAG TPA: MAPEG family protein [Candidatus Limnocylindrales bacterium]|nr:MAPEG family protein [Candidatus Limnocylindrales bacterium]